MESDIKAIDFDADVYDVRKVLELVLHGPDLHGPNDPRNKGRKPNFEATKSSSTRVLRGGSTTALASSVSTCIDGLGTRMRTRSLLRDVLSVFSVPPARSLRS
jgi:hypothetical protein